MSVTNQISNNIIDRSRCQNTNPPTAHRKIYQCHSIKHMYQNTNPIIASIYQSQWMKQVSKHEPRLPYSLQLPMSKRTVHNYRMVYTTYDILTVFLEYEMVVDRGHLDFIDFHEKSTSILSIVYCFKFYNI